MLIIFAFKFHPDYQKLELYRLEGKIRFPGNTGWFKWAKPKMIVDFDKCRLVKVTNFSNPAQYIQLWCPKGIPLIKGGRIQLTFRLYQASFLYWYMDKNRPLPPDKEYDPYRQADFERRKAEGFPKPLYPSDVPTPEYTPEQQEERERIGGW